jgi:hypothetical protein
VQNWLITLIRAFFRLLARGKIFLRAEKQLAAKGFGVPIYKQKLSLNVRVGRLERVPAVFLAGRLQRAETFSRKTELSQ